jgi:hypothetical protein
MTVERDQIFLDPLANTPLKIWEVQSGSMHRLKEEGWEPKLRLTSKEEQVLQCVCVCVCVSINTYMSGRCV